MKKVIIGLISVIVIFAVSLPFVFSGADQSVNFCVLGDSIASGYGVNAGQEYASIVSKDLVFVKYNDAVSGYTTKNLLDLLSNSSVKSHIENADIVEISIGGNDFLSQGQTIVNYYNNFNLSALQQLVADTTEQVKQNVASIIGEIVDLNSNVKIVIQTLYTTNYNNMQGVLELFIEDFNQVYQNVKSLYADNVVIADVRTAFKESKQNCIATDNIHPNVYGHSVIADTIKKTLANFGYTNAVN